jgi:hypothetical protein
MCDSNNYDGLPLYTVYQRIRKPNEQALSDLWLYYS